MVKEFKEGFDSEKGSEEQIPSGTGAGGVDPDVKSGFSGSGIFSGGGTGSSEGDPERVDSMPPGVLDSVRNRPLSFVVGLVLLILSLAALCWSERLSDPATDVRRAKFLKSKEEAARAKGLVKLFSPAVARGIAIEGISERLIYYKKEIQLYRPSAEGDWKTVSVKTRYLPFAVAGVRVVPSADTLFFHSEKPLHVKSLVPVKLPSAPLSPELAATLSGLGKVSVYGMPKVAGLKPYGKKSKISFIAYEKVAQTYRRGKWVDGKVLKKQMVDSFQLGPLKVELDKKSSISYNYGRVISRVSRGGRTTARVVLRGLLATKPVVVTGIVRGRLMKGPGLIVRYVKGVKALKKLPPPPPPKPGDKREVTWGIPAGEEVFVVGDLKDGIISDGRTFIVSSMPEAGVMQRLRFGINYLFVGAKIAVAILIFLGLRLTMAPLGRVVSGLTRPAPLLRALGKASWLLLALAAALAAAFTYRCPGAISWAVASIVAIPVVAYAVVIFRRESDVRKLARMRHEELFREVASEEEVSGEIRVEAEVEERKEETGEEPSVEGEREERIPGPPGEEEVKAKPAPSPEEEFEKKEEAEREIEREEKPVEKPEIPPSFPKIVLCPFCKKKYKVLRPGDYRCKRCGGEFRVE